MQLFSRNFIFILVCSFIFQGCNLPLQEEKLSEGMVKYQITYLEDENENPIISLMPSDLNMKFKDNSVVMEVEGWMGVFKTSFIKNARHQKSITLLKMLNKKCSYQSHDQEAYLGFSAYENAQVTFDSQTKKILDFECKHATVVILQKNLTFDIFYTEEIDIENPNEFTPYYMIPGVLMEFQIEINGIPMYLIASELIKSSIPEDAFLIPEGYEAVPKAELEKIFSSLI